MARRLLLAVLLCAAVDTLLTRLAHAHRAPDGALPLQLLLAWGAFGLVMAVPIVFTARRLGAPFTVAIGWLAGPLALHHALAVRVRDGSSAPWLIVAVVATLLAVLVALVALSWVERRLAIRRWPALVLASGSLLLMMPLDPASRGSAAAPAAAPTAGRPNLLLLVWDTTRADHLSPWGYDKPTTPHLAALAADSATWDVAWSASVFTLSSHVSMLTGLPPGLHGTTMRRQSVTAPSVASQLRLAGYRTGAFVGTSVLAAGHGLERGFEVYDDRVDPALCDSHLWALIHDAQVIAAKVFPALRHNGNPNRPQDFQRPASEVLDAALAFVREPDPRPWFVMVNLFDVHWPYLPAKDAEALWVAAYDGPVSGYLFRADDFPTGYRPDEADKQHVRDLYDGELWQLDRAVDAFLAQASASAPDTCVLMTSDHGEALGEGDRWSHDEVLAPQSRIPMLLHAPGRIAPGRRPGPVSGVDVAATLLDLAGVAPEVASTGRSLLESPAPGRILFVEDLDNLSAARDHHAALRGRWKLTRRDGVDRLTDPLADPLDQVDLLADHPDDAAALEAALDALIEASTTADESGVLQNADALGALGYTGH